MDILKLMEQRHSVRQYKDIPIESEKREILDNCAREFSLKGGLAFKIVYDEPTGFDSTLAHYGNFTGVKNYIVLLAEKNKDEAVGYYGEALVLKAQEIGFNTCWVMLTFNKKFVKKFVGGGLKLYGVIALGYGETQGVPHKDKPKDKLVELKGEPPENFDIGVKAAMLAPTATNQQKFRIICENGAVKIVKSGMGFYADLDLGIIKYHFETASGIKVFGK